MATPMTHPARNSAAMMIIARPDVMNICSRLEEKDKSNCLVCRQYGSYPGLAPLLPVSRQYGSLEPVSVWAVVHPDVWVLYSLNECIIAKALIIDEYRGSGFWSVKNCRSAKTQQKRLSSPQTT
jgi:hypothetical protein